MTDSLRRLVGEARKRAVGGILAHAENAPWWPRLNPTEQRAFRERVIGSINAYHDVTLDTIKVTSAEAVVNEETLAVVRQVHAAARRIEDKVS